MFRVSSHQLYLSSESRVMDNTLKLNQKNAQISSGKKVDAPSDDPVSKRKIMHEEKLIQENDAYDKNTSSAKNQLEMAENAMGAIHDTLDAVKTLTLRMSNDTMTDKDRADARTQVLQALEDIVGYANTEIDGFYIFGGYRTGDKAFNDDKADPLYGTYQGDDFARSLEIAPSVYKQVAFPGSEFITGTASGGTNIITVLTTLAENLQSNNADGIKDRISELDASLEQVSRNQSKTGALLQEVEITDAVLQTNLLQSKLRKADLEEIDVSSAITEFSAIKTALETTMATTSQILRVSLLNYLK